MRKGSTKLISIKTKNHLRYTYMSIKYKFLRKYLMVKKAHFNSFLDIMKMMILYLMYKNCSNEWVR